MTTPSEPLFTLNFTASCISNLFLFTGMYILLPVLPLFLTDVLKTSSFETGLILAAYTIAALLIRPFSGFIVEHMPGKKLFIILYTIFTLCFFCYPLISSALPLGIVRLVHGLIFGVVTTASTTLAISIMPRSRLGSGIGFYGMTAALSMAIGPMLSMYAMQIGSFSAVFMLACGIIVIGFLTSCAIKAPANTAEPSTEAFALKRLMLPTGKYGFISVPLSIFLYGLFLNYVTLFTREKGITANVGTIFALVSTGLIISRFFAGRLIDKGSLKAVIIYGKIALFCAFLAVTITTHSIVFMVGSFFIGLGFGLITPAYQTLFNNLALPAKRATANSMFFTAFDVGFGSSAIVAGAMCHFTTLSNVFYLGLIFMVMSLIYFIKYTAPHYDQDRVS